MSGEGGLLPGKEFRRSQRLFFIRRDSAVRRPAGGLKADQLLRDFALKQDVGAAAQRKPVFLVQGGGGGIARPGIQPDGGTADGGGALFDARNALPAQPLPG